jgi:hypothetical protein
MFEENVELMCHYQRSLVYVGLEDASASEFLNGLDGGRDGNEIAWQREVARFIRLTLDAEFIQVKNDFGFFNDTNGSSAIEAVYLKTPPSEDLLWMGVQFTATKKLSDLLKSEGLATWSALDAPINRRLLGEYESISK